MAPPAQPRYQLPKLQNVGGALSARCNLGSLGTVQELCSITVTSLRTAFIQVVQGSEFVPTEAVINLLDCLSLRTLFVAGSRVGGGLGSLSTAQKLLSG